MVPQDTASPPSQASAPPTGPGAAAILATGIGSLALGVLALAGDASPALQHRLIFWRPTGPLSGVSTLAVAAWLIAWTGLGWRWSRRDVPLRPVIAWAFAMLAAGFLLTFPPFMDLLQGK